MNKDRPDGPDHPLYDQIMVLTSTVRIVRRMRGKKNPEDVPFGSPEWTSSVLNSHSMCLRRWSAIQAASDPATSKREAGFLVADKGSRAATRLGIQTPW